jgi:hypothetical protein
MAFCHLWVAASKIQGQIYELLYCPEAIAQPVSVRQSRVQLLVSRLDDLDILTCEICVRDANPVVHYLACYSGC